LRVSTECAQFENLPGNNPRILSLNFLLCKQKNIIIKDGEVNDDIENASFKIPRNCLKLQTNGENNFSLDLFANPPCPPKWKPLNACRKYAFEIQPEYSSNSSSSASYKAEAFTSQQGARQTNVSKIFIKFHF
jgi:hypothetical protein